MRSEWYRQWLQVLYYVRSWLHIEALWFANVANQLMWCAAAPHTDIDYFCMCQGQGALKAVKCAYRCHRSSTHLQKVVGRHA